jgi:hypothetical protein
VNTLQVVPEVPVAGESISMRTSLAPFPSAKKWVVAVSMHGVCLAFMAEKAGCRGKTKIFTCVKLAFVWLQVGIYEFAITLC